MYCLLVYRQIVYNLTAQFSHQNIIHIRKKRIMFTSYCKDYTHNLDTKNHHLNRVDQRIVRIVVIIFLDKTKIAQDF